MPQTFVNGMPDEGPVRRASPANNAPFVLIIEPRPLLREMIHAFLVSESNMQVASAGSVREWQHAVDAVVPDVILFSVADGMRLPGNVAEILMPASDRLGSVPVVVQSNERPVHQIIALLETGIRGFIPTSLSTRVAVGVLRLICAGGSYIPPDCLRSLADDAHAEGATILTGRQLQVAEAIRLGKPNKIIAYELNMCESTVKVHVRTIMKKLKARNRTEVAYLFSSTVESQPATTH